MVDTSALKTWLTPKSKTRYSPMKFMTYMTYNKGLAQSVKRNTNTHKKKKHNHHILHTCLCLGKLIFVL